MKKKNCCAKRKEYRGNNPLVGVMYGVVPHIGCIAFVIGSILGATILMQFFRPFLMNRYIFHYLIAISVGLATISSIIYLRKNKDLSIKGIRRRKGYLSIMYGSTVGINLILFFLIFPFLANIGSVSAADAQNSDSFSISVNIPCPGHAPLITNELRTVEGVVGTSYGFPNNFVVYYDSSMVSVDEILSLEVFEEYPATIASESLQTQEEATNSKLNVGSCSGGCGGQASCGGGCGSPSCSLVR